MSHALFICARERVSAGGIKMNLIGFSGQLTTLHGGPSHVTNRSGFELQTFISSQFAWVRSPGGAGSGPGRPQCARPSRTEAEGRLLPTLTPVPAARTPPLAHEGLRDPVLHRACASLLQSRASRENQDGGPRVAQSVKHLTSAQVMILQFMGSSPTSGSVPTARSPDPASDSASPSLSAPPLLVLFLSKINKSLKTKRKKKRTLRYIPL